MATGAASSPPPGHAQPLKLERRDSCGPAFRHCVPKSLYWIHPAQPISPNEGGSMDSTVIRVVCLVLAGLLGVLLVMRRRRRDME
jgi:hypothetical protein